MGAIATRGVVQLRQKSGFERHPLVSNMPYFLALIIPLCSTNCWGIRRALVGEELGS